MTPSHPQQNGRWISAKELAQRIECATQTLSNYRAADKAAGKNDCDLGGNPKFPPWRKFGAMVRYWVKDEHTL